MEIHPKDQSIINTLAALEEAGEKGFMAYYHGDHKVGSQEVKEALHKSAQTINGFQDPQLRREAKKLLNVANKAIFAYMKNPTDDNLGTLKTDIDAYKGFLADHQPS
jgi:hypothetical protein